MEGCATEGIPPTVEDDGRPKETDSAVNFQRFVYDLFEKNGILNDLRAYLRGHIVDVLKSAQTGETPSCQKNFTQRLDLTYQAFNMLIAEYLLRLDFSYSVAVFVSEIPLSNMVFSFAQKLMLNNNGDFEDLRFKDSDVWSILNYLGIKCDSEHASRIVEMYNTKENLPLLVCLLKCTPMYQKEALYERQANTSSESVSSSARSLDIPEEKQVKSASKVCSAHEKCKHHVFCRACKARADRLREKYRVKKKHLIKNVKCDVSPLKVESLMRNIGVMERSLVDEMFQQLKGVYEAEVEMVKQDEEKKVKRSLASHALQLQKRRDEMEQSFKEREVALERSAQDKKRFLWGLARALRDQHAALARAHQALRAQTDRLTAKEDSLKSQLVEAEEVLKKRGEDMRQQISSELVLLEEHLGSMKRERDSISRERAELETLRARRDSYSGTKVQDLTGEELKSHYDLLKDELVILKKYLEATKLEPKCVIERSTLTDLSDVSSKIQVVLNNEQSLERTSQADAEERKTPNKVVNDLKKQKNVNFCTSNECPNVDELYQCGRSRSRSSSEDRLLELLRGENDRLKTFARQQREHIDELTSHQARLQGELAAARLRDVTDRARPRTAPVPCATLRLNTSASVSSVGWRVGAGEELNAFAPRVILPGEVLPFTGALRDRHDSRRHLINQWRALRRRASPVGGVGKVRAREHDPRDRPGTANPTMSPFLSSQNADEIEESPHPRLDETFTFTAVPQDRPNTEPQEVSQTKDRLSRVDNPIPRERKDRNRSPAPPPARAHSPGAALREARTRARRLAAEADAVERSYLDYRRRCQRDNTDTDRSRIYAAPQSPSGQLHTTDIIANIDIQTGRAFRGEGGYLADVPRFNITHDSQRDFDAYLRQYQDQLDAAASHFKGPTLKSKPIPTVYSKIDPELEQAKTNFLETPLTEFRKLYTQKSPLPSVPVHFPRTKSPINIPEKLDSCESGRASVRSIRSVKSKKDELEILKDNISKMYNVHNQGRVEQKIEGAMVKGESPEDLKDKDDLIVEVERVSECDSLKVSESNTQGDLMLVVESSVDTREVALTNEVVQREQISTHMTIIVSPKRSFPNGAKNAERSPLRSERSVSPEQAARLTRNDALNAIFHAESSKQQSSIEMELNISKDLIEESNSDFDKADEYPDDFSADVDNYNSRSDEEHDRSPISLPKHSEDDNFWDS